MAIGTKTGGRAKGTPNKATAEVKAYAQKHGLPAITKLAQLMENADSDQAKIAACKEILDRAYGKSPQAITGEEGGPIEIINRLFGQLDGSTRGIPENN